MKKYIIVGVGAMMIFLLSGTTAFAQEAKLVSKPIPSNVLSQAKSTSDIKYEQLSGSVYKGAGSGLAYVIVTNKGVVVLGGALEKLAGMNNGKTAIIKGQYETKSLKTEFGLRDVKIFNVVSAEHKI